MSSGITQVTISALHVEKEASFNATMLNISHKFDPSWSEEQAYGKMDPIATYSHTGRKMTLEMTIVANKREEAFSLQQNVDNLIQMNYPVFASAGGNRYIKSPPFFEITVLNLQAYKSVKGYLSSFDVKPGNNEGVTPMYQGTAFLQRKYDISLEMTVLHEDVPGHGASGMFSDEGTFVYVLTGDEKANTESDITAAASALGIDAEGTWSSVKDSLGVKPTKPA
jgi:hypothetical protein